LLCKAIATLAACCPSWFDDLWMTDATPAPCGASRETVKRSDLAGHAGYGYCASHSRFYWGFKLYLVCAGDGMPIMWCLANPKLGEREVVAALLEHHSRLIRTGQILLADKGPPAETMCLRLLRPDRKDENLHQRQPRRRTPVDRIGQPEPQSQLSLEDHGGRTVAGVLTRVAQRLLALAAGIWHNWTTYVTRKRSLTA
jgi:hypothetical protein